MRKTIGIIGGQGKMGAYFADFFSKLGHEVLISDIRTPLSNIELAKKSDVVIVSVPIDHAGDVIDEVAPHIKKSGLLMDLTSVKVQPMEHMSKTKASYLGCHPMFGPTACIQGQLIVLCTGRGSVWHKWLKKTLEESGVVVRELTAKKHDELMAYIQTLNHFSEIVFADALRQSGISIKDFVQYPSPVYMMELFMMGRILNQDPHLYGNIQMSNPANFKAIQSFLKSAKELAQSIEDKDLKKNVQIFNRSAKYLGDFKKEAHKESDRILKYLKLPQKKRFFEKDPKPKGHDIAVLGPKNTYSDMALHQYKKQSKAWYATSIAEVFELVASGKIKEGLVPIENTTTGSVRETLDELYDENVYIDNIIAQPVKLVLAGAKKIPLAKIKAVYSHSQPLLQCRQYLKRHCKKASAIPVSSTAAALERVIMEGDEGMTAVASPAAVKAYNLKTIQESIEDDKGNTTFFALIKKGQQVAHKKADKKTAIAFHFTKDSPGSLNSILQDFAEAKINLTKIESRPNRKVKGEYVFYIDFEKNPDDPKAKEVLARIKSKVAKLKVLGSY